MKKILPVIALGTLLVGCGNTDELEDTIAQQQEIIAEQEAQIIELTTQLQDLLIVEEDAGVIDPLPIPDEEIPVVGGVNMETFRFLENGMSIAEVKAIIGIEPSSHTTTEVLNITTDMIMWIENFTDSITVTFTDGYATSIMQMGL